MYKEPSKWPLFCHRDSFIWQIILLCIRPATCCFCNGDHVPLILCNLPGCSNRNWAAFKFGFQTGLWYVVVLWFTNYKFKSKIFGYYLERNLLSYPFPLQRVVWPHHCIIHEHIIWDYMFIVSVYVMKHFVHFLLVLVNWI